MTELWLVRHGQTDWNTELRIQGSMDKPLNARGIEQAKELAGSLAGIPFAAVYSSPAKRAFLTATIISQSLGLTVREDERLWEIALGEWEGLTWQQVQEFHPEMFLKRRADPVHIAPAGAETYGDLAKRMVLAANDIAAAHAGKKVLIVSHGMSVATLVCTVKAIPLVDAYHHVPENADPVVIQWLPGQHNAM